MAPRRPVLTLTCNGRVLDDNAPDEGRSVDVNTAGKVTMAAHMAHSPDDISPDSLNGFANLTGDDNIAGATMPFSVTIDGAAYNTLTIGTNGIVQFGTTSGANPTLNASLPSADFPNPTLFFYWDDLFTEGTHIRYGSGGIDAAVDRRWILGSPTASDTVTVNEQAV